MVEYEAKRVPTHGETRRTVTLRTATAALILLLSSMASAQQAPQTVSPPAAPPPAGWAQGATSFPSQPTGSRAPASWTPTMTYAEYTEYLQSLALTNAQLAAQPTQAAPAGSGSQAPAGSSPPTAAQYFTNGAEVTTVPTAGPNAAYYTNGAEAMRIPTSAVPIASPQPSAVASAAPPPVATASAQPQVVVIQSPAAPALVPTTAPRAQPAGTGTASGDTATTLTSATVAAASSAQPAAAPYVPAANPVVIRVETAGPAGSSESASNGSPTATARSAQAVAYEEEHHASPGYWIGIAVGLSALGAAIALSLVLLVWFRRVPAP